MSGSRPTTPKVTDLTGDPPTGQPAPAGTYWTGTIEFFDRTSPNRMRGYYAVTRAGEVFWLDGLAVGGSGDWLPERSEEAADLVRTVARRSLW